MNKIYFTLVLVLLFASCSPSYLKNAKQFVRTNSNNVAVMILTPGDNIIYSNYKEVPSTDSIDKINTLIDSSLFLSQLNNIKIYDLFVNKFIDNVASTGLNVYTQDFQEEFDMNVNKIIVDIAQIQLDEYINTTKYQKMINKTLYYHDTYFNAFGFNIWINYFSKYKEKLLYATNSINDYNYGYFVEGYYYDDVSFDEVIVPLEEEDIESFLEILAYRYSEYIYDYILTDYSIQVEREIIPQDAVIHYNKKSHKLKILDDNKYKFIEIQK